VKSKSLHILLIVSWYKTPHNPVTGTFFEEQARMFQKRGHQVGVLYPHHEIRFLGNTRFNNESTAQTIVDKGLPTMYSFTQSLVAKTEYPTQIDLFIVNRSAYKTYKNYVKQHGKPDIIHAHSTLYAGVVARYLSKIENIPYFLTKHFTGWILLEKMQIHQSFGSLLKGIISDSQKTFIVSHFYKEELLKRFTFSDKQVEVVPNIVNSLFCENGKTITLNNDFHLLVIGYLVERKNHLTLFKAIDILRKAGKQIILHVVGNGVYENTLKNFVKDNELDANIIFHGLLDRDEVLKLTQQSHILISASLFETFGVNLIEALAVGRPVVALDSGGPRDIVTEKDGILLKENTPEAFAKAVETVINNYRQYDQEDISNRCIERFGEDKIYQELMRYYQQVLS
jgi:glycosyltransferase involved in cell wall biosynthesis